MAGADIVVAVPGIGRALASRGSAKRALHGGITALVGGPCRPAMKIGDQGIDRIGRRFHGEAALDAECVGLRQGEAEHAHDSDREQDGDDGNGFQHEWLPGYAPRTKGGDRARQGEAEKFVMPEAGAPYFTFAPSTLASCLAPPLAPLGWLSRIRRSRCMRM